MKTFQIFDVLFTIFIGFSMMLPDKTFKFVGEQVDIFVRDTAYNKRLLLGILLSHTFLDLLTAVILLIGALLVRL